MNYQELPLLFALHLISYGGWWLVFVAFVYYSARYAPAPRLHLPFSIVALLIYLSDAHWIYGEINKPDWDGTPDMDRMFFLGVAIRILLVSVLLIPVVVVGFWLRRRVAKSLVIPTPPPATLG